MERSDNLDLPYIMPSQAQKHVSHNEAIRALDAIVQLGVIDRDRKAPPEAPLPGARHIVGDGASGPWQGHEGEIAAFQDGAWMYYTARPGWTAYVEAERAQLVWDGSAWSPVVGPEGSFTGLSVNGAVANAYNRLAVCGRGSLFDHEDGSHRLVINRQTEDDTAALLLQTDFSGRAEIGLCGDDRLHVKLSADGASWRDVLVAEAGGGIRCGGALSLHCCDSGTLPAPAAGALVFLTDLARPAFGDGSHWRRVDTGAIVGG